MKKLLVFLLFISLIISFFLNFVVSKASKLLTENNLQLKNDLENCKYYNKREIEKNAQNLFSENKQILNVKLLTYNSDTISIKNVINNTKLVYRFYENTCLECVEDELDIVQQLGDSIGIDNILIISNYSELNSLKSMINRKKITSPSFIYRDYFDLPIEKDEERIASFFLLDENLHTQFVYKAGGDQNINDIYYKRIISFFKNGL